MCLDVVSKVFDPPVDVGGKTRGSAARSGGGFSESFSSQ